MKREFVPTMGAHLTRPQAKQYGAHIQKLAQTNQGSVTPELLVHDAKAHWTCHHPASPLHNYFLWNVGAAAEQYWLIQARVLLRHIDIRVTINGNVRQNRAFLNINLSQGEEEEATGQYMPIDLCMKNSALREQILQ